MESKKTLRRRLEEAEGRIRELRKTADEHLAAAVKLDDLGYEPIETENPIYGWPETDWRLTKEQSAKNTARDVELAEHVEQMKTEAATQSRRETLALVIEALEIPGYRTRLVGSMEVDKFYADLTTAVEVRRHIAAATERGRVEKKIASLSKKESTNWPSAGGGIFSDPAVVRATAEVATAASAVRRSPIGTVTLDEKSLVDLAEAVANLNPVTKAAAQFTESTTVDHDVATAGEKVAPTAP